MHLLIMLEKIYAELQYADAFILQMNEPQWQTMMLSYVPAE